MPGKESYITSKTKEALSWTAEIAKDVDKVLISVGTGIFILVNSAVGAAIVIGSAITIVPANEIQKWAKKK